MFLIRKRPTNTGQSVFALDNVQYYTYTPTDLTQTAHKS